MLFVSTCLWAQSTQTAWNSESKGAWVMEFINVSQLKYQGQNGLGNCGAVMETSQPIYLGSQRKDITRNLVSLRYRFCKTLPNHFTKSGIVLL